MPNSISCIAASAPSEDGKPCLQDIPAFYMKKLAYPLEVRRAWMKDPSLPIDINAPIEEVIDITARILGKNVRDVVVLRARPSPQPGCDRGCSPQGSRAAHDHRRRHYRRARPGHENLRDQSLRGNRRARPNAFSRRPACVVSAAGCARKSGLGMRRNASRSSRKAGGDMLKHQFMSRDLARGRGHLVCRHRHQPKPTPAGWFTWKGRSPRPTPS